MKSFARHAAVAALFAGCAVAHATTFNLSLTGTLSDATTSEFDSGTTHFDFWSLSLDGLAASNAFTLNNGDTVNATITLDGAYTMPASVLGTFFVFFLGGNSFPAVDVGTNSTTSLSLGGTTVLNQSGDFGTSSQVSAGFYLAPPDSLAYTFDKVVMSVTLYALALPATVDRASILTQVANPVPEPGTYALMLAGMGLIGAWVRRRST